MNMKPKPIKLLWNVQFKMELGGSCDVFRLCGIYDFNQIMTSPPAALDEKTMIMTTQSGSRYKLKTFSAKKEDVINEIKECIERGGFDVK